jgi:hypothetical protein
VGILTLGRKLLVGVAVLAWPAMAQANIGDNLTQLRQRYGSAKDMGGQMLFEVRFTDDQIVPARDAVHPEEHFSITVYFDGDHSAMEVFTRNTGDPAKAALTQADIDRIMAAAGDGQTWNQVGSSSGKPTWLRSDKKLIARFSPNTSGKPDDASVLVIMLNSK